MFLAIEFQTLLQEEVLFLLVEAESSDILEKLEQGLNEGLKAAVHEEEEQFGHGGLKLEWTGLEVMLLEPKLLERLDEFELEESFVLELTTGMFIGAEVAMMLSLSHYLHWSPCQFSWRVPLLATASEVVASLRTADTTRPAAAA